MWKLSLKLVIFFDPFKLEKLKPLFRNVSKMDLFNFKVISLPPLVSKIFRKNVYGQTKDSLPEKITFYINVSLVLELIIQQMSESSRIPQKNSQLENSPCLFTLNVLIQFK